MTQSSPLAKHVSVDTSSVRLARIWVAVGARLEARPRPVRPLWRWASVSLLVCSVAITTWSLARRGNNQLAWHGTILETAAMGMQVRLADDSRLELSQSTRVEMLRDDGQATAVRVTHGKITCDLPKPRRPFSVFAGDIEVRVTGTRFSVERDSARGQIEVSVDRGSVVVHVADSTPNRTLRAGERWSVADPSSGRVSGAASSTGIANGAVASADRANLATPSPEPVPTNAPMPSALIPVASDLAAPSAVSGAARSAEETSAKELFDRGTIARRAGDSRAAAQAYQALLNRFPNDARSGIAALELGRLRMGPLRDPPGAIAAFRVAAAQLKGSALREDALARLVEGYASLGQTAACRAAQAAYLKDYPSGVHAESIRRQCGGR